MHNTPPLHKKEEGMKKLFLLAVIPLLALATGCAVRTYPLTKDRVDQNLYSGNRGYLMGQPPQTEERERRMTRTTQVLEIELGSSKKVKKASAATTSRITEQPAKPQPFMPAEETVKQTDTAMEKYKVQKGDTLQKISQKFYGTTKKWHKIYRANKDTLKGPDKLYPGKTINIPVDSASKLKEPSENLK